MTLRTQKKQLKFEATPTTDISDMHKYLIPHTGNALIHNLIRYERQEKKKNL